MGDFNDMIHIGFISFWYSYIVFPVYHFFKKLQGFTPIRFEFCNHRLPKEKLYDIMILSKNKDEQQ
jgi:hypothetical protein